MKHKMGRQGWKLTALAATAALAACGGGGGGGGGRLQTITFAFPGNATGEFTTNASGEVVIPGLKADGTQYWLEEVRAPEGYSALTARVPLVVDENDQAIALPAVPGATAGSVVTEMACVPIPRI